MVIEDPFHRVSVRDDAEIVQCIPDPRVAPREIFFGHLKHKIGNPVTESWTGWAFLCQRPDSPIMVPT